MFTMAFSTTNRVAREGIVGFPILQWNLTLTSDELSPFQRLPVRKNVNIERKKRKGEENGEGGDQSCIGNA